MSWRCADRRKLRHKVKMADLRISGLLLTLQLALAAAVCNTGFSVVAPEVAVPGKTTVVLVTLHGKTGDAVEPQNVTVRLETQDDNEVKLLTSASQMITGYGIIPLKIPSSPATHCMLHTAVGCLNEDCTSRSHSVIRLLGPVRDVIIRPSRHRYRPGETITFWVLALDHDLRLVRDELAHVALIDPAGTKVAIWEQLSMDEGVQKLTTILANGARSGSWRIEAGCGGGSSSVDLIVSSGPASTAPAAPVAEQHYVELRFADNMRRRYKPGLPFVGRVEAMSTEKQVRVRVKLYDDTTDIYSQDIDMSTGEGGFVVPTVMADAPYINLQAELVAVEGKEIESHYVLAKERIKKWNSTSKCYLLVENIPTPLQAGSIASASIWSSCGCGEQLLAAVTTGGRAIHWAAVPAPNTTDSKLCRFNYTFPVSGEMAPVSSLLVYYVTETGEPVSDVASFHVRLLHKEVAIAVEERRWWYPRASLQLRVLAPPDSTVCLIGARQPSDTRFDPHQSSTEDHQDQPGPEFVSAGVSLFVGGGGECGGVLYRQSSSPQRPATPHLVPPTTHDRLYMWKCFNYSTQLSTDGVTIAAPSEAGRWSLWALSLSSRGLRFSSPKTINVFRPIQLDFTLPPALKVGETVEVDVKITNNINNCMDVTALLALSAGASFASTGALYVTERLRLGPRGGTQLVVRVAVNTPGRKNITVEITGYSADNCSVSYTSFNNETLVGSVIRSASVLVLPEGLHKSDTQSAYFCANEHLAVSSRGSWEWQWVQAPRNRAGLVLELKSQGAAHVALSAIEAPSDDMYRVVFERSKVWIARGKHGYDVHLASAEQTESDDECGTSVSWCSWWVWWEGGRLSVGRGAVPSERRLLVWPLAPDMRIKFVGFSALWGDKADFRIWNFNEEAGFSQVLELGLPHGVVPGSASGTLLISGGLHLPLYSMQSLTIDQWGEAWRDSKLSAAIASVAPLLALEQMPHLIEESEREAILKKLPEQVQVLLSFRKSDFSFSDHPSMPSHFSTIQMLEILSKIQSYYPVDPELLQSIKKFIQKRQNSDGSFKPLPADKEVDYFPEEVNSNEEVVNEYVYYDKYGNMTDEKIEFEKTVEVTAETLTTLLEVGVESQADANVAKQAQSYLEKNLYSLTSPAALAATVLALVLARSPVLPEALEILKNASTTEEGEFGWPSPSKNAADWLLEDNSKTIKTTSYEAVTMEQYVAAVRVLLAACARGALSEGEDAARFLYYRASTLQKHPSLAYSATKAAAQFAALAHDRHRSLTVSLATAGMELTDTLELRAKTAPKQLQLPGLPTKVFVYATGAGCATVQGTISFSTYTPISENSLLYIQSGIIEEIRPERSSIEDLEGNLPTLNIKTCFRWKGKQRSGILRLEVSLFSGYELHTVNPVVLDEATFADLHYGSRNEAVWFVFANISSACPVCVTYQVRSHLVITGLRPAFAKVYPLTRPDLAAETFFHARPGSLLLRGTNEDDFSTWFDRNDLRNNKINDVESICECSRICKRIIVNDNTTETTKTNKNHKKAMQIKNALSMIEQKVNKTKLSTSKNVSESYTTVLKINNITRKIYEVTTKNVESTPRTKSSFTTTEKVLLKSTAGHETTKQTSTINDYVGAIIIPTATYTNITNNNQTTENQLIPLTGGELIVQEVQLKKGLKTKIANTNLPLLRRKGTLQSTYGENHEKFFIRVINETTMANGTIEKPFKKAIILKSKATVIPKGLYNIENLSHDEKIIIEDQAITTSDKNEIVNKLPSIVKAKPANVLINKGKLEEQEPTTVKSTRELLVESVTSKNLAVVTNNNIKNILYRTKKPKEPTQIKKPIQTSITNVTSTADLTKDKTKTELRENILEKTPTKLLKSINKEIHKIPSKPISETSKIITAETQPEINVQNKKGFEIIDNNGLWELLKENHQNRKPDEKLEIHNLNLNLNHTEVSSNRSS